MKSILDKNKKIFVLCTKLCVGITREGHFDLYTNN